MALDKDFRVKNGLTVNSTLTVLSNVNSISTTTGAVIITGGLAVGRTTTLGSDLNLTNGQIVANGRETTDGSIRFQVNIASTGTFTNTPSSGISFSNAYQAGANAGMGGISVTKLNSTSGDYSSYLSLHTRNNGSAVTEQLRITNTGSVLIYAAVGSLSTNSGALQVIGGVGIGQNLYVGGNINVAGTINASITGIITTATNIAAGSQGQIHYQTAPGITGFVNSGTTGQFLQAQTNGAPVFTNTGSMYVGSAVTSERILGGSQGQINYQTAPGITGFVNSGTTGQFLQAQTNSAPVFTSTGSMYVNAAVTAEKWLTPRTITLGGDLSGSASFDGSSNFTLTATVTTDAVALGTDTTGIYVAQGATSGFGISGTANTEGSTFTVTANSTSSNTTSTIVYRDASGNFSAGTITANLIGTVTGSVTTATNIAGGSQGQIHYQSAPGVTAFVNSGTTGQFLQAQTNGAPVFTNTGSMYVNSAVTSERLLTARTITLAGDLSGSASFDGSTNVTLTATVATDAVALGTDTTGIYVAQGATSGFGISGTANTEGSTFTVTSNATSSNTVNTIVYRDASGNFSANTISAILFSGTFTGSVSGISSTATNLANGTQGQIPYQSNVGQTTFTGPGNTGEILVSRSTSGPIFQNTLTLAGTTTATSTQTGALQVRGGVGIGGDLYVGGEIVAQKLTIELTTITTTLVQTDDIIKTNNTTNSVSSTTGALQILGGAGIAKDVYVGGTVYGTVNSSTRLSAARTITLAGDLSGNVSFDGSTNVTLTATINSDSVALGTDTTGIYVAQGATSGFGISGTANTEGSIFTVTANSTSSNTTSTIVYRDASGNFSGNTISAILFSGTFTGAVSGTATTAINIAGGSQGQIHYQSAPGVTAFVNSGTTGQFLQAQTNSAPVFTNTGSMYVNAAVTSEKLLTARTITLAGDLSGNVSFDGSTNVTLTATVATDAVALGTDTTGIYVAQGATSGFGISGTANTEGSIFTVTSNATSSNTINTLVYRDASGNFSAANVTLAGTTAASSTNSGALQVAGGVGIGGALYIGTSSYIFGAQILTSATVNQFVTAGVSSVSAGTDTAVSQTTGAVVIWNTATLQSVTTRGATTTNIISITNTSSSISTTTGAMIIAGGLGVGRTITSLEYHTPTGLGTRPSSNYDVTGNLGHFQSAANIGRASGGDLNFGDGNTPSVIRGFPGLGFIRAYINNDSTNNQLWYGNSTGLVVGNGTSPAAKLDVIGSARISGVTTVTNSTISISTQSGALQVVGGVGIGGKIFVGGLTNSTSTNVLYYNTSTGEFTYGASFASGGGGGTTSPFSGIFTITNTTAATSTSSGALQVSGGVGVGGSLYATSLFAAGSQISGFNSQEFTSLSGQRIFTVTNGYIVGQVQVFANGLSLNSSDFTASNGTSVTLTEARRLNDIIRIESGKNIGISPQQAYIFTEVVATAIGQTTFVANYNTATVQIFIDGVLRSPTTYTASNGTSVILASGSGIVNGTRMGILSYNSVSIAGTVSLSGGTINGTLNVNGSLQQDGQDVKAYSLAMSVAMGI